MNGMFQYRPLDPKHNELRLIRLCLPLSDGTVEKSKPLCCFLRHVSLDDDPNYIALSYVFGAAEPPSSLNVNGRSLRIMNNLDVALRHLQKKVKSERLWIDAVCINHQDMEEKSVQIPRMFSMYQNANQVIAWLGEAGDDSELVLQKMSCMGEKVLACGTLQEILAGAEKEQIYNIARNVIIGQGDIMIAENKVFNLSAKCADIENIFFHQSIQTKILATYVDYAGSGHGENPALCLRTGFLVVASLFCRLLAATTDPSSYRKPPREGVDHPERRFLGSQLFHQWLVSI